MDMYYCPIGETVIFTSPSYENEDCYHRASDVKKELKKRDRIIEDLQKKLERQRRWENQFIFNDEEVRNLITDIYNAFVKIYPYAIKSMEDSILRKKEREEKEIKDGN